MTTTSEPTTLTGRAGDGKVFDPGTKRRKLGFRNTNYDEFKPGALIKIRLENFVTYKLTEFDLSPSLNMIMGPNGSGKSTFVCAVCLGLASKPEFIGRSKKLSDYIKNGEQSGLIEITLKNSGKLDNIPNVSPDDEVIKITRRLSRLKTKTEYWINGREAAEPIVKLLVSQLNIQLDNLCQFLSQERVASFAALKSEKLLVETLRSIDLRLCDALASLKTRQSEENSYQEELNSKQKRLEKLVNKREELKGSVERLRRYQEKRNEIDIHRKLIPYVQIKAAATERRRRRAELNQAVKALEDFLKEKSPLIALDTEIKKRVAIAVDEVRNTGKLFHTSKEQCVKSTHRLCEVRNSIKQKKLEAEALKKKVERIQSRIAAKRLELDEERAAFDTSQLPDATAFSELESKQSALIGNESEIRRAMRGIDSKIANKEYEIRDLKVRIRKEELSLSEDDKIRILDTLASSDRGGGNIFRTVKDAVNYVRRREEMHGFVLEPPAITVSVNDPRYAAYLAQCVDFNTRIAFTLVGSEAYDRFGNDLLNNYRVNTRELSSGEVRPPLPKQQLNQLGFDFYLSEIVTGDARVIKMLCQSCNIHSIPISLRELNPQQIKNLMKPRSNGRLLFTKFIHGNRVVDMGIGTYSRQVWTKEYECLKKTDFFQMQVMSDQQKLNIRATISQLKAKVEDASMEIEGLRDSEQESKRVLSAKSKEREEIVNRLHELNKIRSRYSRIQTTAQSLSKEIEGLETEMKRRLPLQIKKLEDEITTEKERQTATMKELATSIGTLKDCQKKFVLSNVRNFEAKNLDVSMSDVIRLVNQKEQQLNTECSDRKELLKKAKNVDIREAKKEIESYSQELQERLHSYVENYHNQGTFDLQHVEDTIDRLESEIATLNNDESAISILNDVEREMRHLNSDIPQVASTLKNTQELIRNERSDFEPKVDEIVAKISEKFSELFRQIGSRGHVALAKPTSFSEWKIEIRVAFRDSAELTRLDAQKQSGGERAVSTVLYMIALQPFTTAPFRVVDEINQGMDIRNERIVHKFMVKNACAGDTSQYFLITPKVLPDLYYDEAMMIHCVMAGPWIPNPSEHPEMVGFGKTSKYIL